MIGFAAEATSWTTPCTCSCSPAQCRSCSFLMRYVASCSEEERHVCFCFYSNHVGPTVPFMDIGHHQLLFLSKIVGGKIATNSLLLCKPYAHEQRLSCLCLKVAAHVSQSFVVNTTQALESLNLQRCFPPKQDAGCAQIIGRTSTHD